MEIYNNFFSDLKLSSEKKEMINIFFKTYNKDYLLFCFNILRDYSRKEESIQFLLWGLSKHPKFPFGHVHLIKELYEQEYFSSAWKYIRVWKEKLKDERLFQTLEFKLGLIFYREDRICYDLAKSLRNKQVIDPETKILMEKLFLFGRKKTIDFFCLQRGIKDKSLFYKKNFIFCKKIFTREKNDLSLEKDHNTNIEQLLHRKEDTLVSNFFKSSDDTICKIKNIFQIDTKINFYQKILEKLYYGS